MHCTVFLLFNLIVIKNKDMKTARIPKFDWKRLDEPNVGHTKDEWGKQVHIPKVRVIEAYDLKWNIESKKSEKNQI